MYIVHDARSKRKFPREKNEYHEANVFLIVDVRKQDSFHFD